LRFKTGAIFENAIFFGVFLAASGVFLLISWIQAFHVSYNDFWGILFYARHLSWQEKASLYNGFYPIGYALLLRFLPYGLVIQGIAVMNGLLGGLFSASVIQLVWKNRPVWIGLLVFAFSLSYPLLFEYATSVAPEIGCAAFTALAVFLLWDQDTFPAERLVSRAIAAGALLGLSALWRNHTIVSSAAILAAYLVLVREIPLRAKAGLLAGFLVVFSIQLAVNLISGHALLETAQSFNLYKRFNLVDWRDMPRPEEVAAFSLWEAFLADPGRVLSVYLPWLFTMLSYAVPALAGLLCFPKSVHWRFWLFAALSLTAYALVVSWGGSDRAPLVIFGLTLVSAGFFLDALDNFFRQKVLRWRRTLQTGLVLLCLVPLAWFVWFNLDAVHFNQSQDENVRGLAEILLKAGMKTPAEVFTDSFAVYFPELPPYTPRAFGGWNDYYLWGYASVYPGLPFDSAAAFAQACQDQGIRFLILTPKSAESTEFLHALYTANQADGLADFVLFRKLGNFKIFMRRAAP
jgi:hypothetical protein